MNVNKIEARAEKVLGLLGNSYRVPVNLIKVLDVLDLGVSEEKLDDNVSGMLYINKGKANIGVNSEHVETRQRFTIAHEIGHYVLHRLDQSLFLDTNDTQTVMYRKNSYKDPNYIQEREANEFAAALLMPKSKVLNELTRMKISIDLGGPMINSSVITEMAKKFNVSTQAMNFRLMNVLGQW